MLAYADVCWRKLTYADVCAEELKSERSRGAVEQQKQRDRGIKELAEAAAAASAALQAALEAQRARHDSELKRLRALMEASAQESSRERAELEAERAALRQALAELERDCQELQSTYDASQVYACIYMHTHTHTHTHTERETDTRKCVCICMYTHTSMTRARCAFLVPCLVFVSKRQEIPTTCPSRNFFVLHAGAGQVEKE